MTTKVTVKVPRRFYEDHVDRDLPSGRVVEDKKSGLLVELDYEGFKDLLDDARHYVFIGPDLDPEYFGLVSSARATVKLLAAIEPPTAEGAES